MFADVFFRYPPIFCDPFPFVTVTAAAKELLLRPVVVQVFCTYLVVIKENDNLESTLSFYYRLSFRICIGLSAKIKAFFGLWHT